MESKGRIFSGVQVIFETKVKKGYHDQFVVLLLIADCGCCIAEYSRCEFFGIGSGAT